MRGRIQPFRLVKNVYFVGDRAVSVHLIDTGAGLIMIDTGYPFMRDDIVSGVETLGFDIAELKYILLTHGHCDHTANAEYFRDLTGARIVISRPDSLMLNARRDLNWTEELNIEQLEPFEADILLETEDRLSLGMTVIETRVMPGHTEGTIALFFEISEGEKKYTCAMHGGIGLNSMARDYLEKRGLVPSLRDRFREGLHELGRRHVDAVLGNHPDQNDTEGKLARLQRGEKLAFIDPDEWPRFLNDCEKRLDIMLAEEKNHECQR